MLQMIWRKHRDTPVTFGIVNRTAAVRVIGESSRDRASGTQLDATCHCLRFSSARADLAGRATFYGVRRSSSRLHRMRWRTSNCRNTASSSAATDGTGRPSRSWPYTTMWEIPALSSNELRAESAARHAGRFELDVLYARAKASCGTRSSGCGN
ncbi:MAG: hypothetical protein U1E30_03130 [Rhodoblastus sp.]